VVSLRSGFDCVALKAATLSPSCARGILLPLATVCTEDNNNVFILFQASGSADAFILFKILFCNMLARLGFPFFLSALKYLSKFSILLPLLRSSSELT